MAGATSSAPGKQACHRPTRCFSLAASARIRHHNNPGSCCRLARSNTHRRRGLASSSDHIW